MLPDAGNTHYVTVSPFANEQELAIRLGSALRALNAASAAEARAASRRARWHRVLHPFTRA